VTETVEERAYLSIGEVLALLKEEFPDVTISKIRFLESQGLLDPERTPSGYRKFYETDVERLQWILRQQREHFLPLKVIKGRLRGGGAIDTAGEPVAPDEPALVVAPVDEPEPEPEPVAPAATAAASVPDQAPRPVPQAPRAQTPPPPPPPPAEAPLMLSSTGVSMNLTELAAASGLEDDDLRELERYGLLTGRRAASSVYYDEEALMVAQLAAGFMKYGVEARHLRMYKTAGEREAGFLEQVVLPMLKQRNPQARKAAADALSDLTRLGQGLRAAMLRQALRKYIEGQ
ncbi:MAG TPA: MerR family transcriptional regulator, partial [Acidimicrobiales bacterium]|nr:MerR family transcriptional regulator [Acidimicrobiales bacterium]